jgi:hypothetical protein
MSKTPRTISGTVFASGIMLSVIVIIASADALD